MSLTESNLCAYLSFPGFTKELISELEQTTQIEALYDRLVLVTPQKKTPLHPIWAQCSATDVQYLDISSVSDAAKKLKNLNKRWACYSYKNHRRAELIQEQTFRYKNKTYDFLEPLPEHQWGLWSLIEPQKMLVATKTSSPLPLGEVLFNEDKVTPPSRAYLKLWELFTVHKIIPEKNAKVIDLGSCPGGWTWVLQQVGSQVISVDKAPLEQRIASLTNITYIKKDAFTLKPEDIGPIDWLFSDIICYPDKLLELVQTWLNSGLCQNFVCTIKFQGDTDWQTMGKFLQIPHSRIIHLCHNKHEVTWIKTASQK